MYSCVQLCVLLSPYLCFVIFLYLALYVLVDDTSKRQDSFMQAKHLTILIHIRTNGEVKHPFCFSPPVIFLTDISKPVLPCGSFLLFVFCFILSCLFHATLWSPAWFFCVCVVFLCSCRFPIWRPWAGMVFEYMSS